MKNYIVIAFASCTLGTAFAQTIPGNRPLTGDGTLFLSKRPGMTSRADAGRAALPTWTGSFSYSGVDYSYTMVGTDPSQGSATTTVPVVIVPVRMTFASGAVFDPTRPFQNGTVSVVDQLVSSPIFQSYPWTVGGVALGNTQYVDAFQRANWWTYVSTVSPDYHVLLGQPRIAPVLDIQVPASYGYTYITGALTNFGFADAWHTDEIFEKLLIANPKTFPPGVLPIFVTTQVNLVYGNYFYADGYHTGFYAWTGHLFGTYIWAGMFQAGGNYTPNGDVYSAAASHEVGEWMNDPFGSNVVPLWPNTLQGTGCSNILEVADPLQGTYLEAILNGVPYLVQDLTFHDWFTRAGPPSTSLNGWYSMTNAFSAPAGLCQ